MDEWHTGAVGLLGYGEGREVGWGRGEELDWCSSQSERHLYSGKFSVYCVHAQLGAPNLQQPRLKSEGCVGSQKESLIKCAS